MRIIVHAFILCFLLLSCRKASTEGWHGTITATIDGESRTFDHFIISSHGSSASGALSILTSGSDQSTGDRISIYVRNLDMIVPGIYDQTDSVKSSYLELQSNGLQFPFRSGATFTNASVVTITTVNEKVIQGSFSGHLNLLEYVNGSFNYTSVKKVITDGRFNLAYE